MTIGTKAEFAKHIGKSHQYVSKLGKQGRLVMTADNKVDFEKSLSKITATSDPANDPAGTMPRIDGRINSVVNQTAPPDKGTTQQYQASRAVKESYTARLKKAEYEKMMGQLVDREGVERASFQVGRILRDKLSSLPTRLAPKVTVETDQRKNFIILTAEVENVIGEIQQLLSDLRR